jgi:elongation factor P
MKEGADYEIIFWEDTLIAVEIDNFVDIAVKDTDPGLKGDTATNTFKPAILENGIEIKVPLFISPGDFISVDTRSMEYQGRVNK